MCKHVRLGEISRCAKALFQFVVKAKINVNLFIGRAVERAGGGAGRSAARSSCIAKQHQLGVAIRNALLLKNSRPCLLRVIQHKGYELYSGLFLGVTGTVGLVDGRACATAATQQCEEISFEDKTENQQDEHAADTDVHPAKTEPAASAAIVAAIFNVSAGAAWCPTHVV